MDWLPNGVVSLVKYQIDKDTEKQLISTLRAFDIAKDKIDDFIPCFEEAISRYKSMIELQEKCKPAQTRENLDNALKQINKLRNKLNALDTNSRLIVEDDCGSSFSALTDHLFEIQAVIHKAKSVADEYPKRGRLVEYPKRELVRALAGCIKTILEIRPTMTRDGLLESVSSIALVAVTGKPADGIHILIENTLKEIKSG